MFSFEKMLAWQKAVEWSDSIFDVAHGSIYEVVSVLAILKRRDLLPADEYDKLYKQGDEVASIVYGLSRATFEAEKKQESRSRVVREPGAEYGLPDELQ